MVCFWRSWFENLNGVRGVGLGIWLSVWLDGLCECCGLNDLRTDSRGIGTFLYSFMSA